jgi:uncharacterized protein YbjT (DUF2867 family)
MNEKKIIAVVGATGAQGGGLVRAIVADRDGPFVARALTRDAGSPAAQELAQRGAEVVEADLDDAASMRKAFDGAYGAYVVTNFWASLSADEERHRTRPARELEQAATAAQAAKDAGLTHVIWSTLEDTRAVIPVSDNRVPHFDGKYTVPHFDAKAEADQLFTELGVPTTFLRTTFYFEAFLHGMGPQRTDDGSLVLTLPMGQAKLAGIAADDIGRTALGIFRRGTELVGKTISIAGEHLTGSQIAEAMSKAFGEPVTYRPLTHDQFRALDTPGAIEVGNTFQYYVEAADTFTGARDLAAVRALNPQLQSFADWLAIHKDDIPR